MWARALNTLLGIWLMVAPAVIPHPSAASDNARVVGPVVASIAIVAMSGVVRPLRWVNAALGLWLLAAPFVLGFGGGARTNSLIVGALTIALACVPGTVTDRFGGGWAALWRGDDAGRTDAAS